MALGEALAVIPSPTQGVWHLGPVPIRAYAFCIIAGVLVAVWLTERRWVRRGGRPGVVNQIATWAVPFGIVGARLYHVATSWQPYFGPDGDPISALYLWEGGMGVWGAIAFGALGGWIGARRAGVSLPPLCDAARSLDLVAAGGARYRIEPSAGLTDPDKFKRRYGNQVTLVQSDDWFWPCVVSLGCLGIITSVTLRLVERITKDQNVVIDSIRHPAEVEVLRGCSPAFRLIWVDAPEELRLERLRARKRGGDPLTLEDLRRLESRELGSDDPAAQQLRAVRPLGVDKTLTEIWHFRLKGAPEPIYRRSLAYYNLVNSPSTMINADDLENFWKCHQGLASDGGDWVSFARHHGHDLEKNGVVESAPNQGTSEAPMRNQMKAWAQMMGGAR